MEKVKNPKTKYDVISNWLIDNERNISWLAKKTEFSYTHLYHVLVLKDRELSETSLQTIADVIGVIL